MIKGDVEVRHKPYSPTDRVLVRLASTQAPIGMRKKKTGSSVRARHAQTMLCQLALIFPEMSITIDSN
jgi:hypothetical protein